MNGIPSARQQAVPATRTSDSVAGRTWNSGCPSSAGLGPAGTLDGMTSQFGRSRQPITAVEEKMTTTPYDQPRRPHLAGWLPFIRHYIEMVLAMAFGMVALMPLEMWAVQAVGAPHVLDHVGLMTLVMASDMAIAMGAWMAYRRHGWRDIAEMSAAMYLPFVIFFPATLTGVMTSGAM